MRACCRWILFAALGGCAPQRQFIHYDAQRNVFSAKPAYIATGDSLFLVVHDTMYRNAYIPKLGTADVVVGERAPLIGGVDIGKLADAFPSVVLGITGAKASAESGQDFLVEPGAESGRANPPPPAPRPGSIEHLKALLDKRDRLTLACDAAIDNASAYFLEKPAQSAFLAFIADPFVRQRAKALAGRGPTGHYGAKAPNMQQLVDLLASQSLTPDQADTLAAQGQRYARETVAFSLLLGVDPDKFEPDREGLQKQLDTLKKLCFDPKSSLAEVENEISRFDASSLANVDSTLRRRRDNAVAAKPRVIIAGVDIQAIALPTPEDAESIRALYSDLGVIARTARQVAAALNLAPEYATRCVLTPEAGDNGAEVGAAAHRIDEDRRAGMLKHPACGDSTRTKRFAQTDTIFIGSFWKETQIQVSPGRGNRFPPFAALPTIAFSKGGAPAPQSPRQSDDTTTEIRLEVSPSGKVAASSGGKPSAGAGDKATSTENDGGDKEKAPKKAEPPESPADVPTGPTAAVDVLERYRFAMGVGYGRSSLTTYKYETKADTVDGQPGTRVSTTGVSPNQNFPVLTLSYMILPLRGKVFGGQAYEVYDGNALRTIGRYIRQAGLAVQFGLALDHPTEQIFTGFATEPLPGLTIGYGLFHTYTDKSTYPNGAFVPLEEDPTPVRKQWLKEWSSWTVAVDGNVVASVFGKLLGLK